MKKNKLAEIVKKICFDFGWNNILYSGIVGSTVSTKRNSDVDIVVITSDNPNYPCLVHENRFSLLVLNLEWLSYDKHFEKPTGLVPSILFKSIMLSKPIIGNKSKIRTPTIKVGKADRINLKIKKNRYKNVDEKNYLIALLFERLLKISPDLSLYDFNNIKVAENIGADDLAKSLMRIYKT